MPDCLGTDPKTRVQKWNCQTETRQGTNQKKKREEKTQKAMKNSTETCPGGR